MKKVFLAFLLSLHLYADQLAFNVRTDIDKIAFLAQNKDPFAVEKQVWGSWYLYHRNHGLWTEFRNDEFEFEDASMDYYKKLEDRVKFNVDKYMDATHTINSNIGFGKYNSKNGYFKLDNLNSDTYFRFSGSSYVDSLRLSFNNTAMVTDYDKLFVPREEASLMVKNRKSRGGDIDRTIQVQYDFKIADIKVSSIPSIDGRAMNLNVYGKIVRILYIDQETGKILRELKL